MWRELVLVPELSAYNREIPELASLPRLLPLPVFSRPHLLSEGRSHPFASLLGMPILALLYESPAIPSAPLSQ